MNGFVIRTGARYRATRNPFPQQKRGRIATLAVTIEIGGDQRLKPNGFASQPAEGAHDDGDNAFDFQDWIMVTGRGASRDCLGDGVGIVRCVAVVRKRLTAVARFNWRRHAAGRAWRKKLDDIGQ
jgi:hypothetical protein